MNLFLTLLLLLGSFWFTYTDLKSRLIPNKITHWAILILIIIRVPSPEFYLGLIPATVMLTLWYFVPASIGAGDIKLFGIIGLCMGLSATLNVLFWTLLLSSCVIIVYRIIKGEKVRSLPLAPMITGGIVLTLLVNWPI